MKNEKLIKLNKAQVNELIKSVGKDNDEYGLGLKLIYVYGRNISEVAYLKKEDVDLENNIIIFNKGKDNELRFKILESLKEELGKLIELKQEDEEIFNKPIKLKDNINYLLYKKTGDLTELDYIRNLKLTTKDFKILRGQHLYQDGVSIHSIHELYHNKHLDSTKKLIKYNELVNKRVSIDTLLEDYTDLNLYSVGDDMPLTYYCTNRKKHEAIMELDNDGLISVHGDSEIRNIINDLPLDSLIKELGNLRDNGDYKYIKGLRIMKN